MFLNDLLFDSCYFSRVFQRSKSQILHARQNNVIMAQYQIILQSIQLKQNNPKLFAWAVFCHFSNIVSKEMSIADLFMFRKHLQTISYPNMSSEFDVTVAYLQDIYKQASLDSQKLTSQIRQLRQQLEQMQKNIDTRTDGILREITPRIEQLQEKMNISWGSIQSMDKLAWEELEKEKDIFNQCRTIVEQMDFRIDQVTQKI